VAWADKKMDQVEVDLIMDFAQTRLHFTDDTAEILERWLKEPPSRAYVEQGLTGLLGIALQEEMLEVDVSELQDLVVHAEALAAATAEALHDPSSVTPEEEQALQQIASMLQVNTGSTWGNVLESLKTQRPPELQAPPG
jgi:hypothetical protein